MDFTTNKLILAGYLILGLLVGVVGYTFVQSQRDLFAVPEQVTERPRSTRKVTSGSNSTALSKQLQIDIRRQRERITELQNLLAKRETILRQQAAQIETKTTESKQLQEEADRYLQLLTQVAQESVDSIDENLNLLESADTADELLDSQEPLSNEVLEAALQAAQWELDQSHITANESAVALAEEVQRTLLLRQALIDAGESSIPVLVSMLSGDNTELRVWSASALGQVGHRSPVAIDSLLIAAEDPDLEVRTAAQASIQGISEN